MTAAELEVTGRSARLVLRGEIDVMVLEELRAAVDGAREKHVTTIDVDLALVDFMDSSGLGVLAQAAADFERVRVVAAPISVIRILELTGLGSLVAIGGDTTDS